MSGGLQAFSHEACSLESDCDRPPPPAHGLLGGREEDEDQPGAVQGGSEPGGHLC